MARGLEADLAGVRVSALEVAELHADAMSRLCGDPPEGIGSMVFARLSEAEVELFELGIREQAESLIALDPRYATPDSLADTTAP